MTTFYHITYRSLQEVGYRDIEIVNSTDMRVNVTNPQTNESMTTVPAKLVEMTYSTTFAPNETRSGYLISTATDVTAPLPWMTKGYTIFYEGGPVSAAEMTIGFGSLRPLPPAVGQIFDSFELMAAPEVEQPSVAQGVQPAETTEDGGDNNNDNDDNSGANDEEGDDNNVDDEAGGDEDDSDIGDGNGDGDSAREGDGEDT